MIEEKIIVLLKENSYSASDISRKLKKDRRTVSKSLEKLNERVYAIVKDAQDRCVANGRKTVKASDI